MTTDGLRSGPSHSSMGGHEHGCPSAARSFDIVRIHSTPSGSRPVTGSSSTTVCGLPSNAEATHPPRLRRVRRRLGNRRRRQHHRHRGDHRRGPRHRGRHPARRQHHRRGDRPGRLRTTQGPAPSATEQGRPPGGSPKATSAAHGSAPPVTHHGDHTLSPPPPPPRPGEGRGGGGGCRGMPIRCKHQKDGTARRRQRS